MTNQPIFDRANYFGDDDDFDEREHLTPRQLLQEAQRLLARVAAVAPFVDDFDDCA
jgi:hypothetical protein